MKKVEVLVEDIAVLEEYIQYGKELGKLASARWGATDYINSSNHTVDPTVILKQLRKLRADFERVDGLAQGAAFEMEAES